MSEHRPTYLYCSDPEFCCGTHHPLGVFCAEDGERWPCATKRSHHTDAYNGRVRRWAEGRANRPAKPNQRPTRRVVIGQTTIS